jgi:hypothetical protein
MSNLPDARDVLSADDLNALILAQAQATLDALSRKSHADAKPRRIWRALGMTVPIFPPNAPMR